MITFKMHCQFEKHSPGYVVCQRPGCNRIVKTPHPPDRVHARCRSAKSLGLGDTVYKLASITGLGVMWNVVRAVAGKRRCGGCPRRQQGWNKKYPYPLANKSTDSENG